MIGDLYQKMELMEFYRHLIETIAKDREKAVDFIQGLKGLELYENDFVFRTLTDTVEVVHYYTGGKHQEIIPMAITLIERATNLGLWSMATRNLNMLGASYQILEILEKALECYNEIIKIEHEQGYVDVSPLAYNNIGLMYLNLDAYKKAAKYFDLAVEKEKIASRADGKHDIKQISFYSNQAIVNAFMGYYDEAAEILGKISREDCERVGVEAKYFYYIASMIYYFHVGRYDEAKEFFRLGMKECSTKRDSWKRAFLIEFVRLSNKMKLNYAYFVEVFDEVDKISEEEYSVANANVLDIIRKYYKQVDDIPKYEEATARYLKTLQRNGEHSIKKQVEALELLDNLIEESNTISKIRVMNKELKRLADEAIRTKKNLQVVNERLRLVSEIGKKMTSSLELSRIIDMIHESLSKNVPFDSFVIMLAEPEKNRLRTLAYYLEKVLQPEISININNPDSIFVYCYKTGEVIVSDDIFEDERFLTQKPIYSGDKDVKSVIYMPLKVDETMVGACSIQSKERGIYKDEHVEFLEMFLPYLSIAINNAVHSEKLEKAIKSHLKAQEELQKANSRLEQLSSLDGLTKISNRRDFEKRILKLISSAKEEEKSVSVLMVDIDNFKIYNDTYGHLEGDEALKKVAEVIRDVFDKAGGISARFGGEEFVGAGEGFSKDEIMEIGENICKRVYEKNVISERTSEGRLTVSVGVAYSQLGSKVVKSELMKAADDALYEAKKTGKNRVILTEI